MNAEEDNALVYGLHADDISSFDALYHKYHQVIYRNIYKFTKDPDTSLDILQDIFTLLWEKRMEIRPEQSVSGWLFVLSFNRSISHLRRKLKEEVSVNKMPFTELEPGIDSVNVLDDQYYLLNKAIDSLSPQKKKVFTLCKLEGKTYEEAAERLNISKHTVKEYLGHAVSAVKNHIKEHQSEWKTVMVLLFCFWLGNN